MSKPTKAKAAKKKAPAPFVRKADFSVLSLGDLVPDPNNLREHNPRNVDSIEQALKRHGAARSIVIDEKGVVLAGNATLEAAQAAGFEHVIVVPADGKTLVAVQRSNLDAAGKVDLAISDNRTAELATGWRAEPLKAALTEFSIPPENYFYPEELKALTKPLEHEETVSGAGGIEESKAHEIECPNCHTRFMTAGVS